MGLFGKKQKGYLGIDFGAGGIKMLQLTPLDGRGKLFTYGFTEFAPAETSLDYLENPAGAGQLLKKICEKARTTTTQAVAALPIPAVFSAVLSLTAVPKKELLEAVKWEAKKLIPLPLEDVVLDYKVLKLGEVQEKGEKSMAVLLTAAPRGIIEKYVAVAKAAGLTLVSLETEAFALIRSLIGTDPTPTVIVDIGALRSNILIVDRGIPMFTRSVEIGGKKCTEAIAKSLGLDLAQAEAMKRDAALPYAQPGAAVLAPVLQEVLQPLLSEMKYSFNVYRTRNMVARKAERIILTGGGAGSPGLAEFLAGEFNLRTYVGNPWELTQFHPDLAPLLNSFGVRFAVSVGLALRQL